MCTHRLVTAKMRGDATRHPHPIWPRGSADHCSHSSLLIPADFLQPFWNPRQIDCSLPSKEFFVSCPPRIVREHDFEKERYFSLIAFSSAFLRRLPQSAMKDRVREVLRLHYFVVSKRIESSAFSMSRRGVADTLKPADSVFKSAPTRSSKANSFVPVETPRSKTLSKALLVTAWLTHDRFDRAEGLQDEMLQSQALALIFRLAFRFVQNVRDGTVHKAELGTRNDSLPGKTCVLPITRTECRPNVPLGIADFEVTVCKTLPSPVLRPSPQCS
jgi:hypothetical protein